MPRDDEDSSSLTTPPPPSPFPVIGWRFTPLFDSPLTLHSPRPFACIAQLAVAGKGIATRMSTRLEEGPIRIVKRNARSRFAEAKSVWDVVLIVRGKRSSSRHAFTVASNPQDSKRSLRFLVNASPLLPAGVTQPLGGSSVLVEMRLPWGPATDRIHTQFGLDPKVMVGSRCTSVEVDSQIDLGVRVVPHSLPAGTH
ncbi:hypothetical protein R1flu_002504 [Riccia fluitans]|uniref:Ribosomal protein S10 n=1 Tax=Riccia fluitans TaxID=41844 RepID=A0ABD1Y7B3_9MARC